MCGHHEVVDVLCEDEAHNVHRMLSTSPLLLHVAARSGHDHIVWRLCASSANVNEPRQSVKLATTWIERNPEEKRAILIHFFV